MQFKIFKIEREAGNPVYIETEVTYDNERDAVMAAVNKTAGAAAEYKKKFSFDVVNYDGMTVARLIDAKSQIITSYAVKTSN